MIYFIERFLEVPTELVDDAMTNEGGWLGLFRPRIPSEPIYFVVYVGVYYGFENFRCCWWKSDRSVFPDVVLFLGYDHTGLLRDTF